mgnify:CR=1 FL=1
MANNEKTTQLTELTSPATTDLLAIIDDASGTPTTKKVTLASIDTLLSATTKTLTNKTLTSPVLNTKVSGTAFLDEDAMTSNSATKVASQQSIKAYIDSGTVTMTNKTLTAPVLTTPQINDTSADHQYIVGVSELEADRTMTLPLLTGNDEFVFKAHAQTLINKTLTSAVLNTGVSGTAVLDEDDLTSNSATKVATQQSIKAYSDLKGIGLSRQAIINGNFDIWQRRTNFASDTTPANSDDTYLADRWVLLSDGNDVTDVTRSTNAPVGSAYSIKFQVETANKKFGILQILENVDALKLDDKSVSISFQAKTTTGKLIENLRVAVLAWDGTADTVTSDVVSAWAVEGTNPTFATNWTAENTAANKAITTSWAKYEVENIAIDTSGMTNIAVFIWVDDTDAAVDDELFISQVQLCAGEVALPFQPKSFEDELAACQRYYCKTFLYTTAPVQNGGNTSSIYVLANGTKIMVMWFFPVHMRKAPTVTTYSPDAATSNWRGTGTPAASTVTQSDKAVCLQASSGAADNAYYNIHASADAEL